MKHSATIEHYLVPTVLFLTNICLVHVIQAFSAGESYTIPDKVVLAAALLLFGGALVSKRKSVLIGSLLFYALAVFWI